MQRIKRAEIGVDDEGNFYVSGGSGNKWQPLILGGENSSLLVATKHISSEQILALDSEPITLVEGVSGSMIWPTHIFASGQEGITPYSNMSVRIGHEGDGFNYINDNISSNQIDNAINYRPQGVYFQPIPPSSSPWDESDFFDGVSLIMDNGGTGDPTDGDISVRFDVYYLLIPLT